MGNNNRNEKIKQRYLSNRGRITLQQLGDEYGITRERVRQIVYKDLLKKQRFEKERRLYVNDIQRRKLIIYPLLEIVSIEQIKKVLQGLANYNQSLRPVENILVKSKECFGGRDKYREYVRRRDNQRCQLCGCRWKFGERKLDVHHIYDENGEKTRSLDKNIEDYREMITLCHQCHLRVDKHKMSYLGKFKLRNKDFDKI